MTYIIKAQKLFHAPYELKELAQAIRDMNPVLDGDSLTVRVNASPDVARATARQVAHNYTGIVSMSGPAGEFYNPATEKGSLENMAYR